MGAGIGGGWDNMGGPITGGGTPEFSVDEHRARSKREFNRITMILLLLGLALGSVLILLTANEYNSHITTLNSSKFKVGDTIVHKLGVKGLVLNVVVVHNKCTYEVNYLNNNGVFEKQTWESKEISSE